MRASVRALDRIVARGHRPGTTAADIENFCFGPLCGLVNRSGSTGDYPFAIRAMPQR